MSKAIRPEDILPDGVDKLSSGIRKGTVAAFLANLEIFENPEVSEQDKQAAMNGMKELAPNINAVGLHKHVVFKNAEIEQILLDAENG